MGKNAKWLSGFVLGAFAFGYILGGTPGFAQTPMMGLDGKSFVGQIGKKGEKIGDKDELIFKDRKLRSTACEKYGFGEAPYTFKAGEDEMTFEAVTTSAKEGTMRWNGTVKGGTVTATVVWSKSGKVAEELWYTGKMRE